jgi:hypothetical protein
MVNQRVRCGMKLVSEQAMEVCSLLDKSPVPMIFLRTFAKKRGSSSYNAEEMIGINPGIRSDERERRKV